MGQQPSEESVLPQPPERRKPRWRPLVLLLAALSVVLACHLTLGWWLLYGLPEKLFASLPRQKADDITAAVAKALSVVSPLLVAMYLLGARGIWRRMKERAPERGAQTVLPSARPLWLRAWGVVFWLLVASLVGSGLFGFLFYDAAGRSRRAAQESAKEIGFDRSQRYYQVISQPDVLPGTQMNIGGFSVMVPQAWPQMNPVPSAEGRAFRCEGVTVAWGGPSFPNFHNTRPPRGEELYCAITYYQVHDTADFLETLCTFSRSDLESADSVLGNCASIEVLTSLAIFWFDSAWSFPVSDRRRVFVFHTSKRDGPGGDYLITLTDEVEGDLGGLLVVYTAERIVPPDEALSLAASLSPREFPRGPKRPAPDDAAQTWP